MKYFQILLLAAFLTGGMCKAQSTQKTALFNDQASFDGITKGGIYYVNNEKNTSIEGSVYLFEWTSSSILTKSNKTFENRLLRYDALNDEFEVKDGEVIKTLSRGVIESVSLGKTKFITITGGYFEVLAFSGNVYFLKRYKAVEKKGNYKPAINAGDAQSKWVMEEDYFFSKSSELSPMNLSKNDVSNKFNLQTSEIESFKKMKLRFTKEEDVCKIFALHFGG